MNTMTDFWPHADLTDLRNNRATVGAEFAEAARLIADLRVLVDGGLIDVDEPFGGPARYRAAHGEAEAA